jgi:hypothetical protein
MPALQIFRFPAPALSISSLDVRHSAVNRVQTTFFEMQSLNPGLTSISPISNCHLGDMPGCYTLTEKQSQHAAHQKKK